MLVVFITYGEPFDSRPVDGWADAKCFPDWAMNAEKRPFYNDYTEFTPNVYSDSNRHSVSNFYYQMSAGQFELIADLYRKPVVVNVDPHDTWGEIHRKAINQISGEIGYHVTNQASRGDVILEEGSRVIMDADNEVHLEPGVEVKLGATLEVR